MNVARFAKLLRLIAAAVVLLPLAHVAAQPSGVRARVAQVPSAANMMIVVETSQRWLHGRQSAAFTPPVRSWRWVAIDRDDRAPDDSRVLSMHFRDSEGTRLRATVALDSRGRLLSLQTHTPRPRQEKVPLFTAGEELINSLHEGEDDANLALPASRVWDVIPPRPPRHARVGARWLDTLNLRSAVGIFAQRLTGVRASTIVGDTVVGNKKYLIVRDSASVRYTERSMSEAATLDTSVILERRARGTMVGRYLLDVALGLFHQRVDTTRLEGEAELEYPDGRAFSTPARYERARRFTDYTTAAYDSIIRERNSLGPEFSIIVRPEGIAEKLARGERRVDDSLLAVLAASRDPEQRREITGLLGRWSRASWVHDSIRVQAFARGDTVLGLEETIDRWERNRSPIDTASMHVLVAVLADPGYALSLGIDLDAYYQRLSDVLLKRPPAAIADTLQWPCTPEACRMLGAQWPRATEPRLRALGLLARFVTSPESMRDTVLMQSDRAPMMSGARTLAIATSAIRAGSDGSLPMPDASWRSWRAWRMKTEEWRYHPRVASGDARLSLDSLALLKVAEKVSGRDLKAEWLASFAQQRSDSGRLELAYLLSRFGAVGETNSVIAAHLVSASPEQTQLGLIEMMTLLTSNDHPADSSISEDVVGQLLAISLDGAAPWPLLYPATKRDSAWLRPQRIVTALDGAYGPNERPVTSPIVLIRQGVPPGVLEAMRNRGVQIVDSRFALPTNESALILTVSAPQSIGPFLKLTFSHQHSQARVDGHGQSWASGATYYLLRTESGWKIVTAESWIT